MNAEKCDNCGEELGPNPVRRGEKVLLQKQPKEGRWGGLWMFPYWRNRKEMLSALPLKNNNLKRFMTLHHGFTKYRIRLDVYAYTTDSLPPVPCPLPLLGFWAKMRDLSRFALPSPHQKIAKELLKKL